MTYYYNSSLFGVSTAPLVIYPNPSINVVSPSANLIFVGGSKVPLKWSMNTAVVGTLIPTVGVYIQLGNNKTFLANVSSTAGDGELPI